MSKSRGQFPLRQENDGPPPLQSAAADAEAIASRCPLQKTSSRGKEVQFTKAFGLPLRSLLRDPDEEIPPPSIAELSEAPTMNSPDRLPKENSFNSPLRSPTRRSENHVPLPIPKTNRETPFLASPFRSPMLGADSSSQQPLSTHNENASRSPGGDGKVAATNHQSVLEEAGSPMLQTGRSPENPLTMDRMAAPPSTMSAKVGRGGLNGMRVESGVVRWPAMKKAELGLRILEVVLSMISFSVMAADKTTGWAGDSFDRYQEFRYCISMNVIAFVYSLFQVFAQFYKMKNRSIIDRPLSYYLDFSMDQVLAYLLMSASSSAAARNDDWISMFGSDKFTDLINGSITLSFLAFLAFAVSSIISADKLFSWKP